MFSEELKILKDVVQRLVRADIKYIVTGSVAANFYAQPRMTRDIDIVVQLLPSEAEKIFNLFKDDFYIDIESIEEAIRNKSTFNVIHNEEIIKVDFLIADDSAYERSKFKRKKSKDIEDISLSVISPEDLILSKLNWAKESLSEMQLNDVRNIIVFNKDELDWGYLESWALKLSTKDLLEKCLDA